MLRYGGKVIIIIVETGVKFPHPIITEKLKNKVNKHSSKKMFACPR